MAYEMKTTNGYDLYEVASALQKSIRRGDIKIASFFALELFASGFDNYCWKRLLTVSAEDVEEFVTREIVSLHYAYELINKNRKAGDKKGRIFITKAVFVLCKSLKSRETDHYQNLVYDKRIGISRVEIKNAIEEASKVSQDIPEYAYDIHTLKGKRRGKTKKDFFLEEQDCLVPMGKDEFIHILKEYIKEI